MQAVESLFRSLLVFLEKHQNSCLRCSHCVVDLWQSSFFTTIMKKKEGRNSVEVGVWVQQTVFLKAVKCLDLLLYCC